MSRDEAYAAVIHQAVHDAVHTQLAAPPESRLVADHEQQTAVQPQ